MPSFRIFLSGLLFSVALCSQSSAQDGDESIADLLAEGIAGQKVPIYRDDIGRSLETWSDSDLLRLATGPSRLPRNFDTGIDTPRANTDPATIKEIIDLIMYQSEHRSSRNKAVIAIEDLYPGPEVFFLHGLLKDRDGNPALWRMLDMVDAEVIWMVLRDKAEFQRARPFEIDSLITPLVSIDTPSYPAMMSARAWAAADVLSRLNPVCKPWYEGIARNVGEGRQVGGVSYPSDVEAAKDLAGRVVEGLISGGHLAEDAAAVRDEALYGRVPFIPCHFRGD